MYLGSDSLALAPLTRRIAYLQDGDWTVLWRSGAVVFNADGEAVSRPIRVTVQTGAVDRQGRLPPLHGKGAARASGRIGQTLARMLDPATRAVALPELPFEWAAVPRATITACGGAYFAELAGRHWIEQLGRLPVDIDVASELRYRDAAAGGGRRRAAGEPKRRDRGHAGRAPLHARRRAARDERAERAGKHHGARKRHGARDGGRAGNRGCEHQGVHRAADGDGVPGGRHRP